MALAAGAVISAVVDRTRPFVAHPGQVHLFSHHAADAGFPSDHATAAFAIAGVLVGLLGRRALPVLLAAVLLAVARVLLGLHYPGDVRRAPPWGCSSRSSSCARPAIRA